MSSLSDIQFQYHEPNEYERTHTLLAKHAETGESMGALQWYPHKIKQVWTEPEHRRQGVATALWNEGHRLASENAKIPQPKHSPDRTDAGNAWAKSVGGKLPRRLR
jgi:GNAT superfamily N-acetyltransferase